MSRVTKLQKRYYAQRHGPHSRHTRRILNRNRSQKQRVAQGGRLWDWVPYRPSRRDRRSSRRYSREPCACGHRFHGKYGCMAGCAWGWCSPRLPSPMEEEFRFLSEMNEHAILGAFALPRAGLMNDTLLMAHMLSEAPKHPSLKEAVAEHLKDRPDLEVFQEGDLTLIRRRGTTRP